MSKYKYKLNAISGEFDLVGATLHFKESVASYSNLPTTGNTENDSRFVRDTDKLYTWSISSSSGNLSDWKEIGSMAAHASSHQDTGGDKINVAGLSGELADPQPPKTHTHLEIDVTDLNHYDSTDFATDFGGADLANLGTKSYNDLTDKPDLSDLHSHINKALLDTYDQTNVDISDAVSKKHNRLHTINDINDHTGLSGSGIEDNFMAIDANGLPKDSGKSAIDFANSVHTHLEVDITDLDHDALKIKGITIDDSGIGSGKYLKYDGVNIVYDTPVSAGGDMLKSVYDIDDNGIVDKAEALNDGSSGGGNNVTAQEAREHLDDTSNPHNVTPAQVGDLKWVQSIILNTPSIVTRLFGQSANGFHPEVDIRLLRLHVQYYSEHPTQNKLRVRVYRYDANAATDRLILSVTQTGVAVGYHNIEDITPDTNYYDLDVSAGDTYWMEFDDGAGTSAQRVREITISMQYKTI